MPLKLVTGPANSGKAGEVLGAYRARLAEDPVLVVPRFEDVEHSRRELAGRGVVFGARVVRFADVFAEIAQRALDTPAPPRASRVQRELIVERVVGATRLRVMARSAARPGFVRAATRFVAEIERAMIEPDRLERALRAWAGSSARRGYAEDVAAIYAGYRKGLAEAGLTDDELFARAALDALRREPHRWGRTPLFLYGFDDFTPLELDAIETVAGRAGADVVISLPYERGRAAFRAVAPVFARLEELADEEVALGPSTAHYAEASRPALHHLERGLFAAADGPHPEPGAAVRLHTAGGERAEVELVAADVLGLLREGTAPGDVAVVFRDPGHYATLVDQVFGAYGVPFAIERNLPFAHTALGRALLAYVRAAGSEGTDEDLLTWLRAPGRLRQPERADRLEARVRQDGRRTARVARELWERDNWPLGEIDRLRGARRLDGYLAVLEGELERLFADPYRRAAHLLSGAELEDARAFVAARGGLRALRAAARGPGAEGFTRAGMLETLAALPVIVGEEAGPDRVRVAAPEAIRARRYQAVYVCGLQAGEFPRAAAPEPFLADDVRREVNREGGLGLPIREDDLERERHLFYVCATRAERRLVLSTRLTDEEGNPAARSFLVDEVAGLLAEGELERRATRRTLADVTWAPAAAPTELEWERGVALRGPRRPAEEPAGLFAAAALEQLENTHEFSAGALETFADCPVKWLVEKLLRPDALEPDPEPMVRGSFAHDVLRATFERLRERTGSARLTAANLAEAETIMLEALAEKRGDFRLSPHAARVRAAERRLEFDLLRHLRHEAASGNRFEPTAFELDFGMPAPDGEEGHPGLDLGNGDRIHIRGRIDRIDTLGEHALVRDYKGGKTVFPVAKWAEKHRLQAPLYMLVAREVLGLSPAGGVYVPLGGTDRRPRGAVSAAFADALGADAHDQDVVAPEALDALLDGARGEVREVVGRLRSGAIRPCPETCAWNGGCSYPSICRREST